MVHGTRNKRAGRARWIAGWLVVGSLLAFDARAYTIDTSTTAISGLWWNASESGWGVALTQQYNVIFVTLYTYDGSGNPVWYVASSCAVTGGGCSGTLYRVNGGTPLTSAWIGGAVGVTPVGSVNIAFNDVNSGSMSYTLNGASSTRTITRQVFASPPVVADARAMTLQMAGAWSIYASDQQTLYGRYTISSANPIQGTNGWFISGGLGIQAGYNTTLSKYYVIDVFKESGFVHEYHFNASVGSPTTGCRYRYPSSSSDKGVCTATWATHT